MATVHRATQQGIEGFARAVALKRLLPELVHNEEFVRAFVREARIASHLRHANCAQTYDLGRVGGVYYIAMELVQGHDLRRILRQTAAATGPMPVPLIINLVSQICDALEYAHSLRDENGEPMGIIHRDVSPANIIVSKDGHAKLIDFGIAKASAANLATMSGQLKGKFAYMAPESLEGNIDARADLFAVGVIAHELLVARPLFTATGPDADDFETLRRVRSMPIVPPSEINHEVPADLDTIVLTALARKPDERWQSAAAMRSALASLARTPALAATRDDVARWISWAFQQAPGSRPSSARAAASAEGRRDPNDTDSPKVFVETDPPPMGHPSDEPVIIAPVASATNPDEPRTQDDGLLQQPPDTQPGVAAPKTLFFGSGILPARPTGSLPAIALPQQSNLSGVYPIPTAPAKSGQFAVPNIPLGPAAVSEPVASGQSPQDIVAQITARTRSATGAVPIQQVPVLAAGSAEHVAEGTPHTIAVNSIDIDAIESDEYAVAAANYRRGNQSMPPETIASGSDSEAAPHKTPPPDAPIADGVVHVPQQQIATSPIDVVTPKKDKSMALIIIVLIVCIGAAAAGFAAVSYFT